MAKKIFKYPMKTIDFQVIQIPQNAEILTIQAQHETPCIWAIV